MLKLLPALGALPTSSEPDEEPAFDFAATAPSTISYLDGHPFEAGAAAQLLESGTSCGKSNAIPRSKASEDDKLRVSLGWVRQADSEGA